MQKGIWNVPQMMPKENFRVKERVNSILYAVNSEGRGAQLLLSDLSRKC